MKLMSGWKTWFGGLCLVGLGAYTIAIGDYDKGVMLIGQGASIIGIGHKVEKSKK